MEDEGPRRKRIALLIAGIALTLIILDISGVVGTTGKPTQGERTTATTTLYVTRTVTNRGTQTEPGTKTQTTSQTTSNPPSNTNITHSFTLTQETTGTITPTVNRLESWMLFVSLDPQPSFTASGIWRINDTAVGALLVLVGDFSTHLVPYRAVLNLTIKGLGIDATFHQEELPLNGKIETRTTAYELTLNHIHPPEDTDYLVLIYFQREDGTVLKAQGWDRVSDEVYREVRLALRDKPPWEG